MFNSRQPDGKPERRRLDQRERTSVQTEETQDALWIIAVDPVIAGTVGVRDVSVVAARPEVLASPAPRKVDDGRDGRALSVGYLPRRSDGFSVRGRALVPAVKKRSSEMSVLELGRRG